MVLKVKGGEPKKIVLEDGVHKGKITQIESRAVKEKDYSYLDLHIQVSDVNDVEVKVGYALPKNDEGVSPKSKLGELIARFTGQEVVVGREYDLEKLFLGRDVQFMSLQNQNGYSEVMKESVKLVAGVRPVMLADYA